MPEPPETVSENASPTEIMERLDLLKERYRTGLMDAAAFNDALKAFQFTDAVGHVWAPGVTSSRWYRWDKAEWTAADPPAHLNLPGMPIMFTPTPGRAPMGSPRGSAPAAKPAPAAPTSAPSKAPAPAAPVRTAPARPAAAPPRAAVAPPAPAVTPAAAAPAVAPAAGPKFCPQCGAPAAGKKFCSKCGRQLA